MEPGQRPTLPSDSLRWTRPASTDERPFYGGLSDEHLLDPSALPHGPEMFQGYRLPDPSYQSAIHHPLHGHFPGGNGAAADFNISNTPHTDEGYDPLGPASQQFRHGNASHPSRTFEYLYVGRQPTIHPFQYTNFSLPNGQQSTPPLQNSLGPHPQSQERTELGRLSPSLCVTTSFGPPPEAATTSHHCGPVAGSEPQVTNLPLSPVRGIELESPRPADGETTVRLRRETHITLRFDMKSLSSGSTTYDGLKIPSTPSVKNHGSEAGKKLLHLQILVLGVTTKAPYDTLCDECKGRAGIRGVFIDFHARSDILPQKKSTVLIALTLGCYSKHREPHDSEYCLEVVLNGSAEQDIPFIRYQLPYSFIIVPKLPPRTRHQAEEVDAVDAVDAVVPPPHKLPKTGSGRANRDRNQASQRAGPPGPDELASGDPRGPEINISPGTSVPPAPPVDTHHPASPVEAPMPSQQGRQVLNAASDRETADGQEAVIERTNPSRGPTTGGPEIWISGSNFPAGLLYARFGDNFAHAVVQKPDVLSCRLPRASVPGTVTVALSRLPKHNAPILGTSICQFEYFADYDELLPVMIRIREGCTPEFAAALDIIHKGMKTRNLERNGKGPLNGGETRHDEIETAIIQALTPLQNTTCFEELISKTSDYKQTLAHFAVDFGYTNLLRRLVEWNIDLTIADVNGFTALHCAYNKGDRACVELLLENGASEIALDALGRAPYQLMSQRFASLNDHDPDIPSDDQPELGQKLDAFQSTNSGHGVSRSDDEKSMYNAELLACDGLHGAIHEMSFRRVDSPEIDRYAGWPLQQSVEEARVEALAEANARVVEAHEWARKGAPREAREGVRTRARAQARALALAQALTRTGGRPQTPTPMEYTLSYNEVLADSKLKHIIYSIDPDDRCWLAHNLWRRSRTLQEYWWLIQIIVPITRLPPELLQPVFRIIIDEPSDLPLMLTLVCKNWYTIVTGTWTPLRLGTRTPEHTVISKLERDPWLLDVVVDMKIDHGDFTPLKGAYEAIFAAIEASRRWRTFVVESLPAQTDLPEHLVNRGLHRCSNAVMNRLRTFKVKSACEMSPLLDRLLHIIGKSASGELSTVEIHSPNVVSFLASTYSSMFRSIKVLCLETLVPHNPVDILPHLHQLEALTASHLSLPIYPNDVTLPFVHTLRHLSLRAVSIQWMGGRIFHTLETCALLFPLHCHAPHTFHTTLPNCKNLTFQGYPLDILAGVSAHKLAHLSVMSSCSQKPRGDLQLIRFASQALQESRFAPRILHIRTEATTQAWTKALGFMSNLEELVIDNAQPSSLGAEALQSLVVPPVHAKNLGPTTTPGRLNTPACPSLKRFGLRYRRWLRASEHFDLIPTIKSIILSRQQSEFSLQSFQIWTTNDRVDPLELIEGLSISLDGFNCLADDCAIKIKERYF